MSANVPAAETHVSPLIDHAVDAENKAPRRPGRWAGRVTIADDFDATPEWLIEAFEGS